MRGANYTNRTSLLATSDQWLQINFNKCYVNQIYCPKKIK